jgi:two-component system NtrC family sensor kinase
LTVRSSRSQDHIILEIGDNGCGIPAENLSSLFDPFFTTKATEVTGDEPVGTGLGLYMIVRRMEPYEVEIKVDSKVDVGTTFRLHIPLTRSPETPTP